MPSTSGSNNNSWYDSVRIWRHGSSEQANCCMWMSGQKSCFLYDVDTNNWREYSKSNVTHCNVKGVVHKVTILKEFLFVTCTTSEKSVYPWKVF